MKVIKVGRGYENDEVLNDSTVSRNHLEIFFGDDRLVVVTDLNSANGTTVNGKKINEPTKLDSLDILKAGNSLINWKNYLKDNNTGINQSIIPKEKSYLLEVNYTVQNVNLKWQVAPLEVVTEINIIIITVTIAKKSDSQPLK